MLLHNSEVPQWFLNHLVSEAESTPQKFVPGLFLQCSFWHLRSVVQQDLHFKGRCLDQSNIQNLIFLQKLKLSKLRVLGISSSLRFKQVWIGVSISYLRDMTESSVFFLKSSMKPKRKIPCQL